MRKLILCIIIVLVFIFTTSARTTFTSSSGPSYSSTLKRRQGRTKKSKTRLEAYRCVLNVYKREQLIEAKNEACKYINNGKKTWGFSRWPKPYKPPNRLQFSFYSNTFRLWPLEHDGKIFKGGVFISALSLLILNDVTEWALIDIHKMPSNSTNHKDIGFFKRNSHNNFIVLDGNCQFAGVVALFKSKATLSGPCPIIGCHAPVVKEYKNCEPMKVDETIDSEPSEQGYVKEPNGKKSEKRVDPKKEEETEGEGTEGEETEEEEAEEEETEEYEE